MLELLVVVAALAVLVGVMVRMPSSIDDKVTHSCVSTCPKERRVHEVLFGETCDCDGCGQQVPPISGVYKDGYAVMDIPIQNIEGLPPNKRARIQILPDARDQEISALKAKLKAATSGRTKKRSS